MPSATTDTPRVLEVQDRFDKQRRAWLMGQVGGEAHVEFDLVEREPAEIGQ
jgi:hypothetical protein